jgi:hypothetical protein
VVARAAALAIVGLVAAYALSRPAEVEGDDPKDGFVRVPGIVHVHTTHSDGGGTPDEVVAAAKATGARFVILTDHNNLDAKAFEGYRDGVLVIVGSELSTTAGHIVGIGIEAPAYRFSGDGLDGLEDIRDLGGAAFAAHPFSSRADLRFTGWDLPGPWGLELINGDSEWRSAGLRVVSAAFLYAVNRRRALLGLLNSPDEALSRWDRLLAERDAPGLAGADAHSRLPISKGIAPRFPSYESMFALMRNYVLLKEPLSGSFPADRHRVLEAIRMGRSYVGIDAIAPADRFSFTASSATARATMGETLPPSADLRIEAGGALPRGAVLSLLRNGALVGSSQAPLETTAPSAGVYRVEVRVPGASLPWIISNPIYVFDDATVRARKARAAWPEPLTAPAAIEVVDDFNAATKFQAASDPTSSVEQSLDPRGGADGGPALSLSYRIGKGTESNPNVFVATVDWTHRNLTGREGLVLSVKGDGVYRITVQVRDENKASAEEGTEWWFGSVRTLTEWRRLALPFARLRSINPRTDGKLDLDKVRAIVFLIDRGAAKPGAQGRVWIDDLGVY